MHAKLKYLRPSALSLAAALLPLSLGLSSHLKIAPPATLFVAGLLVIVGRRRARADYRMAGAVVLAGLLMAAFVVGNVLLHGLGWRPLDRTAHLLLYLVAAAAFTLRLRLRVVWAGFSLASLVLGTVCVVQHAHGIDRAYGLNGGASASIGIATLLLGLALGSAVQLTRTHGTRAEKLLHLGGLTMGIYGALLTQSRGPLLAAIPMFAWLAVQHVRRSGRWRNALVLTISVSLCIGAAMAGMRKDVVNRLESVGPQMAAFEQHTHNDHGPLAERLYMWRTAARAFYQHPLAGIGIDRFDEYVHGEISAGRSAPAIAGYNQPHNEFLRAATSGGLPGLMVLLAMFLLPLGWFMRHARDADEAVALPALFGAAVIGLYMFCALTDSVFYRVMTLSFYFFVVFGMAVLIGKRLRQRGATSPDASAAADRAPVQRPRAGWRPA